MAREINDILVAAGYTTIVQYQDFQASRNFVREMQKALSRSARLVALYSPEYEASDHCQAEWAAAYNEDPGGRLGKLVPIMIAPTKLNPLARQVVYKSIVGLSRPARHLAVLSAVTHISPKRSLKEMKEEATRTASPDIILRHNRIDIVPNAHLDEPQQGSGLDDAPTILCSIIEALMDALPANAPPVVNACLSRYRDHLLERATKPIVGLLLAHFTAIEVEFRSVEADLWGQGLGDLFESLFEQHSLMMSHFPKMEKRERFFAETPVDETIAMGERLARPVQDASDALSALSAEGMTTKAFDDLVQSQKIQASMLATMPPSDKGGEGITPKTRWVFGLIGFYERILAIASGTAAMADSAAVRGAIIVLRRSVDALLQLIKG
ncbi:toll/interleukin-1 receptor domain-containing protein [Sphingobium sp. KCTC 72723]|uniref:toll/interleukin-1 receptor domain-containing protein n=1 Tax=Sphingobium sp. KCTC 72723 TaxID=2733867 RepID=UPI0021D1829A|nr:toll/interleukin-1 receptor domain-containing protein [Sphingobium sp. KCTC 72723]